MDVPVTVKARLGFTILELMIVLGITSLLTIIALPNFLKARKNSSRSTCIANLKTMEAAKTQWGMETRQKTDAIPTDDEIFGIASYIKEKPECPSAGTYALNSLEEYASCNLGDTLQHFLE